MGGCYDSTNPFDRHFEKQLDDYLDTHYSNSDEDDDEELLLDEAEEDELDEK